MNDFASLVTALVVGELLGLVFFGGLWWTVRRAMSSPRVALWFFASMLLRTAIVLAGFYLVGGNDWRRWLALLLGFSLARFVVNRLTKGMAPLAEGDHAP